MIRIATLLAVVFLLFPFNSTAQIPNRFDVLITELMADPAPPVGLPNYEWIELHNTSGSPYNLAGWRLTDASGSMSGPLPNYLLKPDSMVIICSSTALSSMLPFGPAINITNMPSLDNTGDIIYLKSAQGKTIHTVQYTDAYYNNELKKAGGWTLEMIDRNNPCSGASNWTASTNAVGGTPGQINAVAAINPDKDGPILLRASATDSLHLLLVFNESLDSAKAVLPVSYTISNGIGSPVSATAVAPLFNIVVLTINTPIVRNTVYTITVTAVTDCKSNTITANSTVRAGLATVADSTDIIINEILFNPKPGGTDYVELYNRSKKIIDLKQLHIANRSSAAVSNIKQVSADSWLLFPGDYVALSEDPTLVLAQYNSPNRQGIIPVSSMPSYNDDKGNVVLLNMQGKIVDELAYEEKWHFPLVINPEGIALERISANTATQDASNWHSASAASGYGTPAYKNSQSASDALLPGTLTITPEICSPNNDGQDDYLTISYQFPQPGYLLTITIFDAAGRPVRSLQRQSICGIQGSYRWDGLGEQGRVLPTGSYIVLSEAFNLQGKTKRFKNVVVLVGL